MTTFTIYHHHIKRPWKSEETLVTEAAVTYDSTNGYWLFGFTDEGRRITIELSDRLVDDIVKHHKALAAMS